MADIVTDIVDDTFRRNSYAEQFNELHKSLNNHEILKTLINIPFDAIITTNYTYQIEQQIDNQFIGSSDSVWRKKYACCARSTKTYNAKSTINSFNRVSNDIISHDIWHMHGEARRKSSIILTHDEYGRLVKAILDEVEEIGNKYCQHTTDVNFKSWIDYFLMGDIYILGLGMAYSEFDLWWMLTRRMRERAKTGQIIFYEPASNDVNKQKHNALTQLGVKCETLGFSIIENDKSGINNKIFQEFYSRAIADIANHVQIKERIK
jgi:hypothetical protein